MVKGLMSKVGIVVIIGAMVAVLIGGIALSTYRPGWELSTELVAFRCNNCPEPVGGERVPGSSGYWHWDKPKSVIRTYEPTANIEWDPDHPEYGIPNVKATVGDVREEYPKMPYEPLESHYGNFTYVVEYHEYLFDVEMRTIADVNPGGGTFTQVWIHETSMPYEAKRNAGVTTGEKIGKPFDGGVYVRFSNLPWGMPDYGPVPENYTFNGYWLGIMNAKVEDHRKGVCDPTIQISHKGWWRNVESRGSQLNMYEDDGRLATSYAEVPWDITKTLDPDIENVVIVYLPFELMAGAWEKYDPYGGSPPLTGSIVEMKPVDVYLDYTVRMECLVVKEYEFRDPGTSPNPSPIGVPGDYVPYSAYSFWEKYGLWIVIGLIAGALFLLALAMFGGIGIFAMVTRFLPIRL